MAQYYCTQHRAFRLKDLLERPCTLVVGPPYFGKSAATNALQRMAQSDGQAAQWVERTDLKVPPPLGDFPPPWWTEWKASTRAVTWCVDALDEGEERRPHVGRALTGLLLKLSEEERARLRLLVTCRGNEVPPDFVRELAEALCTTEVEAVLELAPVDSREAEAICGGQEALERVKERIRTCNLKEIAGSPAVLRELARIQPEAASTTEADIWRSLLKDLLVKPVRHRVQRPQAELESRFLAAQRLGLLLTFGDFDEVVDEEPFAPGPSLEAVFANVPELLPAARDACRSTMFQLSRVGFRIHHRHVREWLAAFALDGLEKRGGGEKARALLSGHDGRLSKTHATIATLLQPLTHAELGQWLKDELTNIGAELLEGLFVAARKAPFQLSFQRAELSLLAGKPGIEALLEHKASQLSSLSTPELSLLLQVSLDLRFGGLRTIAIDLALDDKAAYPVRVDAVQYLSALGTPDDLRRIEPLADIVGETDDDKRLMAYAGLALLKRGIRSVSTTLEHLPRRTNVFDVVRLLYREVKHRLTLQDALNIVDAPKGSILREEDDYLARELYEPALEVISRATLGPPDIERLLRLFISADYNYDFVHRLQPLLLKNTALRRDFYAAPEGSPDPKPAST